MKWATECKEPVLSISTETNQKYGGLPLSPLLPNINFILKKINKLSVFSHYLLFDPFLSYNHRDRCGTRNFYCYWERELTSPSHGDSRRYSNVFFNLSFHQPCLLFIMKATVESFRAAGSCGYPASYKHGRLPAKAPRLHRVESWHPSPSWPPNVVAPQLCLVPLTTRRSEIALLCLPPEQPLPLP